MSDNRAAASGGSRPLPAVDRGGGRGFHRPVSRCLCLLASVLPLALFPARAQEAVRAFVSVEPFEFRVEALVKVSAYREAWRMEGERIGAAEKQPVLDNLETLFESGFNVKIPGNPLVFNDRTIRFVRPDPERGYVPDERESIPLEEALVGLTLSSVAQRVGEFDLEWLWFAPGQERLVLEIASTGKPAARILAPDENRVVWKREGEAVLPTMEPVPGLKRETTRPLRPLFFLGLAMIGLAAIVVLRRKTRSPAWVGWLIVLGTGVGVFALRHQVTRVEVPGEDAAEEVVYALLRNIYHAFDFRDESAIYDTLEKSVTGPLLEEVYLEVRSSLELENSGGPRVRVYEIALRECEPMPGGDLAAGGFETRAEWVTIGEVTHWGHTHERTNRYEAEVGLVEADGVWKVSALALLNEERVQKTTRRAVEVEEAPVQP